MDQKRFTMKEQRLESRPREKLLMHGAETLTDAELLAIILRVGSNKENVVELSERILNHFSSLEPNCRGMNCLKNAGINELLNIHGIKEAKAAQILAVIELAKRFNANDHAFIQGFTSPKQGAALFMNEMRHLAVEEFRIVGLNVKKRIKFIETISRGTLDSTLVHPREVFKSAIGRMAHSIVLVHNHPTGDPRPSQQDIFLTKRLREVGDLMDIPVIDHIIIGDGEYFSFVEENM